MKELVFAELRFFQVLFIIVLQEFSTDNYTFDD